MITLTVQLRDLKDTEKLGTLLGSLAKPGEVFCLDGQLGAGKTTLSQAIARGAGVGEECYVTSPSFAIMHEYSGRLPIYHMDFYRLQSADEIEDLGFEDYFYHTGLTIIEWSVRAKEILPEERVTLEISINEDLSRTVLLKGGNRFTNMLQRIGRAFDN